MKRKKVCAAFLALVLAGQIALSAIPVYAAPIQEGKQVNNDVNASNKPMADGNELRMWYTTPGTASDWENSSLVIGNGKVGGILFGQVEKEQIHFNEKTLWNGGPSQSRPNYDGGNRDTAVTEEELNALRTKMDDHTTSVFPQGTATTTEVWGDGNGMGQYQDFGDLYLDFGSMGATQDNVENYVRDLDMNTAVSSVNYDYNGVHYEREYFASHKDRVVVTRLTASEKGKLSFTASVAAASGLSTTTTAKDGKITLTGTVMDNQLQCEMQAQIVRDGGTMTDNPDGTVTVENADAVTIVYATDTDYKNEYPVYRTGETAQQLSESLAGIVDAAAGKTYDELKNAHIEDYTRLFGRVSIDLGGTCAQKPTNEMMADYRNGIKDPVLEEMVYQFGRYLTIAASREGDELPSNLCGIWMIGSAGKYWGADFHFNVNVQMNYWPAYQTNLAECGSVFTDYMESLVQPGRVTAERSAGQKTEDVINTPIGEGNGFLVNTQNNPFGCTAPFGSQEYGWNVTGSSWALQNVYDQYLYTQDKTLLAEQIYPMLKEMTNFWDGFLWWSDYQNRLVVGPSFSAEQGPTVNGTAYDQSLVWEVYEMAIDASETLGVDEDKRAAWKETQEQLNPIIIGDEGQVKEWYEETTTGKAQAGNLPEINIPNFGAGGSANQGALHRHTSQLIGLYPGTLINKDNQEWMDAAIKTLEIRDERGSAGEVGASGTGWSKAHKLNMWARTGNGENTYKLLSGMIAGNKNGILDNFLDSHPPYQIDGNYGLTAGMTEALLQSQLGYTQFLPAISEAWDQGNVQGIVARGNFVIGMEWSEQIADSFTITSRSGGTFTGEYENLASYEVKTEDGQVVETEILTEDKISFPTETGKTYVIDFNQAPVKLQNKIEEAKEIVVRMQSEILAEAKAVLENRIAEAEAVIEKGESEKYYEQTKLLTSACKDAMAAISLSETYETAVEVYANVDDKEDWPTYLELIRSLKAQMEAAEKALQDGTKAAGEYQAIENVLQGAIQNLEGLAEELYVVFNPEGGSVQKGQKIELSCKYDDLTIRYTIDGNDPMWFSDEYTEPILVDKEKVTVKAALFNGNRRMGDVATQVYMTGEEAENIAPTAMEAAVSNYYDNDETYNGQKAVDGNQTQTRWATEDNTSAATLELTFAEAVTVDSAAIVQYYYPGKNDISNFNVEYWDGENWISAFTGGGMNGEENKTFVFEEPITADKIRLNILEGINPSIFEFKLYKPKEGEVIQTNKTALLAMLEEAEKSLKNGEVEQAIESVQKSFMEVYEYAKGVSENAESSQSTIDKTTVALAEELHKLGMIAGDKTELQKHYDAWSAIDLNLYLDGEEKDQFKAALEKAYEVLQDNDAMQEDVEEADKALLKAAEQLILKPDKSLLKKLVELGETYDENEFVSAGWDTFVGAMENAKAVIADEQADRETVEQTEKELAKAIGQLRYKADKSILENTIQKAEALDLNEYTIESTEVLTSALKHAKEIYDNEELSEEDQSIVDLAVENLEKAMSGLVEKNEDQDENPDEENQGNSQQGGNSSGNNGENNNQNQGQSSNLGGKDQTVKTGDTNMLLPTAGGILFGMATILGMMVRKKKR